VYAGDAAVTDVALADIRKVYGEIEAVRRVNLTVEKGEFFSLLGPSGCGKTTTLRMVAGFVQPTEGRILIQGKDITNVPPERREIGIVFQNYAIFPHMDIRNNIAYGLKMRKIDRREINKRVEKVLETVGLTGYGARYQRELSGGEQQRVALARVLVIEPRILLLDEPLSALDKKLREEMKYWIKGLQHELGITTIYVTHYQNEALTMSDRLAVMNKGAVEQVGTPREIYERPASRFVTDFIGESNILEGRVDAVANGHVDICFSDQRVQAPKTRNLVVGERVSFVVRPENVKLGVNGNDDALNTVSGLLKSESYQGSLIRYELEVGDQTVVAEAQNTIDTLTYSPSQPLVIGWPIESTALLVD
jgi:putative spermidine/putrescine transport system ATP-binding protein